MLGETYTLHDFENCTVFWFESQGKMGKITKVVLFTHKEGNIWNFGFGDYQDNAIHDSVVSNNDDLSKVMFTVVKAAYMFLERHKGQRIFIQPVDKRRGTLYNLIFKKRWHEIAIDFHVWGWIADLKEPYNPSKIFDAFEVEAKMV